MNPWLSIPAADYEAHMAEGSVAQLQALNRIFHGDLLRHRPRALLVAGCATGNGFEHIDPAVTKRVVGIDINPDYLAILRHRHAARLPHLELVEADLVQATVHPAAFDLVHAALVLEYVDVAAAVERLASWVRPGGVLTVVLQEPSAEAPPVSRTAYPSLLALESLQRLVDPAELTARARAHGLVALDSSRVPLPQGKAFAVLRFGQARTPHPSSRHRRRS